MLFQVYKDLWKISSKKDKTIGISLLFLMFFQAIFEIIGIISIFPLFSVLSNQNLIETNKYLNFLYYSLKFENINYFLIFLTIGAFCLITIRTFLSFSSNYAIMRFSRMRTHLFSSRLLESYVGQPYEFFLNKHSGEMCKSILNEVEEIIGGCLSPSIDLIAQFIILIFLLIGILLVNPIETLIPILCILLIYVLFYLIVGDKVEHEGIKRNKYNSKRFQITQEVLSGIKEIKISGNEKAYFREFNKNSLLYTKLVTRVALLRESPRYLLELASIGSVLSIVLILLFKNNGDIKAVLPTLSVFALGGLRILPAVQKLYQSIVAMRFNAPALCELKNQLFSLKFSYHKKDLVPLPLKNKISLIGVNYKYRNSVKPALEDISLEINSNSMIGIVGSTGAGKSTLLDLLVGLLEPSSGSIKVDNNKITNKNSARWQKSIGYVPQQIFIADDTVERNIALGQNPEEIDFEKVILAAKQANIYEFIENELPKKFNTKLGEKGVRISGGQRQRIGIARALYSQPSVIILDEATSSLDNKTEKTIINSMMKLSKEKTLIMIAHRLNTVQFCDCIFYFEKGKLIKSGTMSELSNDIRFKEYAGME